MSDHYEKPNGLKEFAFFSLLVVALVVATWIGLRAPIMWVSFYVSYYLFSAYEYLPLLMTATEYNNILAARKAIPTLNPTHYGLSSLITLFEYHGYVWRWVIIPTMLWWGWKAKQGVVRFKFRRHFKDVYDLIEVQAKFFPASAIVKGKNILAMHPYVGPWATYALPLDFALDHQMLWVSRQQVTEDTVVNEATMAPAPPLAPDQKLQPFPVKRKLMPSYRYVCFHVERANGTFTQQLGPLWAGAKALPPLERALFAVFCTQAAGKQGEAWKMIEQLAFSFKEGPRDKSGKLTSPHYANTKGTDELLAKYAALPAIKEIEALHAHAINVMTAALALARKKGRLMHSNFLWLKPVNRTLWYALCGQGGQSAYWEAAGPWAHAQVEQLMGKRITTPMVAGAIEAMRDTMSREHWIDPGEYSEAAQQRLVQEANAALDREQERIRKGRPGGGLLGATGQQRPPVNRKRSEDDEP